MGIKELEREIEIREIFDEFIGRLNFTVSDEEEEEIIEGISNVDDLSDIAIDVDEDDVIRIINTTNNDIIISSKELVEEEY